MIATKQKYTLKIEQSEYSESPREWDNVSKLALFHNRYNLPNESLLDRWDVDHLDSWDCVRKELIRVHDVYPTCIKPVFMYDHGNIALSTNGFNCPWDSGQVGFVFVDKKTIKKECITRVRAINVMHSELNTYNQYISGDVWDIVILDDDDNFVDSVSGYYGYDYAEAEGNDLLNYYLKND